VPGDGCLDRQYWPVDTWVGCCQGSLGPWSDATEKAESLLRAERRGQPNASNVNPGLLGWAGLTAAILVLGPPTALLLMGIVLRLLGVPRWKVSAWASRYADLWAVRKDSGGLSEVVNALLSRSPPKGGGTDAS
jgi:hypothetical protein